MSLNCKEIDVVLGELDLNGSFIQQIVQPTFDSLALYTYKAGTAKTVLICLAAGVCRLHETRRRIPKTDKALRFMEFLRSRIKGSRIDSVHQIGQERIVLIRLSHGDERYNLYLRLWSGAANILVTLPEEAGCAVLDVFYRRPKRGEITGGVYNPFVPEKVAQAKPAKEWLVRSFKELEGADGLTFNEKVDRWYAEQASALSREALLEQAEKLYNTSRSRMESALSRLEEKRSEFLVSNRLRHIGDLILANAAVCDASAAAGAYFFECTDYDDGGIIRIEIDVKKRAHENAQVYYERYKKAVSGLEDLERDILLANNALQKLEHSHEALRAEENPLVIQQRLRKQKTPRQQLEKKYPGLSFLVDGWHILVGRTAAENDELLRRNVKGLDLWLHTRDWPGGYVFIKNRPSKTVPLDVLLDAGNLALFYSKGRKAGRADLYYTQVKHLRRAKNAPKGTVLPTNEKNLSVELDTERLRRLELSREELL